MSIARDITSKTIGEASPPPRSKRGDWTWELVTMFPQQGDWTERHYESLDTNQLVEFSDGVLEFLPTPMPSHARLSQYISDFLRAFVTLNSLGEVFWAPFSIRVSATKLREPDIAFLSHHRIPKENVPPNGADLVVEILSEGSQHRHRDLHTKRSEYASAGIPEYWIVDPITEIITVLVLENGQYVLRDDFKPGRSATSRLLSGFAVDVKACFDAGRVNQG